MLTTELDIAITVIATGVEAGEDISATRTDPGESRFADQIKVYLGDLDITKEMSERDMSMIENLLNEEIHYGE